MDLTLSRKAWFPAASGFSDAISHCSNYPLAYVYASFLTLSGHILGRSIHIRYATPLYPNHYTCLVGASGIAHKSTAMSLSMESLGEGMRGVKPLRGITTSRGLLQEMQARKGGVLLWLDEFATMTQKKRQDYAADLLSRIVELYGCPPTAGNYTGYDPIEVKEPYVSILAGSTVEWLRSSLTNIDLMAGLGNRMTFVLGDPRPDNPWPKRPYLEGISWDNLLRVKGPIRLDADAMHQWTSYYSEFSGTLRDLPPFTRTMAERIPEKILKCAMIISAWEGNDVIDPSVLAHSTDWGDYLYDCVIALTPQFQEADQMVLASVRSGTHTRPELFRKLSSTIPPKRIREAIDNLRWLGMVKESDGYITV